MSVVQRRLTTLLSPARYLGNFAFATFNFGAQSIYNFLGSLRSLLIKTETFNFQNTHPSLSKKANSSATPTFLTVASVGNPGSKYQQTRHNMGHLVADKLKNHYEFQNWQSSSNLKNCVISIPSSNATAVPMLLYKSSTYMNVSGEYIAKNYNLLRKSQEAKGYQSVLVILNDELSLDVGKVQLRKRNSSPRGHNGLKSIKSKLGGGEFLSIAIGVGRPVSRSPSEVASYVLSKVPDNELEIIDEIVIPKIIKFIDEMLAGKHVNESL